jgi:hypothetical protein
VPYANIYEITYGIGNTTHHSKQAPHGFNGFISLVIHDENKSASECASE